MSAKKTCSRCEHWRLTANSINISHDGGEHRGRCGNEEKFVDTNEGRGCPRDGVTYWDYEGNSCGFATGADFGCVHFKRRKEG